MTNDFRALCAELLRSLEQYPVQPPRDRELADRARTALAEGEKGPVPRFADVERLAHESGFNASDSDEDERGMRFVVWEASTQELSSFARAVLARYGSAPRPIPVAERLPGAEDCDAEGRCWWLSEEDEDARAFWYLAENMGDNYWLPAHALPIPENTDD